MDNTSRYTDDPRVTPRTDDGFTIDRHGDTFQVLYQPGTAWAICLGDQYAADPYIGEIAADPARSHAVVGYGSAGDAIRILIGEPVAAAVAS